MDINNDFLFVRKIIVGGLPRSGSTLLRFILDSSDEIISGPETAFFTNPLSDILIKLDKIAYNLSQKLDMNKDEIVKCILNSSSLFNAFDCLMYKYMTMLSMHKNSWAEKTPRNCYHYHRIFSESSNNNVFFISMVRNGLDVVTSVVDKKNSSNGKYWVSIQRYVDTMKAIYSFENTRHIIFRYEDLCMAPEQTIKDLLLFLNVNFDKKMIYDFNKFSATRDLSKVNQPKIACPIQSTWINRWRDPVHSDIVSEFLRNEEAVYYLEKSGYPLL